MYSKSIEAKDVFIKTETNTELNINFLQIVPLAETEAVFTKTEMNKELNINFLQNSSFSWNWSCIYQNRKEQRIKY